MNPSSPKNDTKSPYKKFKNLSLSLKKAPSRCRPLGAPRENGAPLILEELSEGLHSVSPVRLDEFHTPPYVTKRRPIYTPLVLAPKHDFEFDDFLQDLNFIKPSISPKTKLEIENKKNDDSLKTQTYDFDIQTDEFNSQTQKNDVIIDLASSDSPFDSEASVDPDLSPSAASILSDIYGDAWNSTPGMFKFRRKVTYGGNVNIEDTLNKIKKIKLKSLTDIKQKKPQKNSKIDFNTAVKGNEKIHLNNRDLKFLVPKMLFGEDEPKCDQLDRSHKEEDCFQDLLTDPLSRLNLNDTEHETFEPIRKEKKKYVLLSSPEPESNLITSDKELQKPSKECDGKKNKKKLLTKRFRNERKSGAFRNQDQNCSIILPETELDIHTEIVKKDNIIERKPLGISNKFNNILEGGIKKPLTSKNTKDGYTKKGTIEKKRSKEDFNIDEIKKYSFMASLTDNVLSYRCDKEAKIFKDNFKKNKDVLTRKLYTMFNENVFDSQLDAHLPIVWNTNLITTAGRTVNKKLKTPQGISKSSMVELSTKVLDSCQRLRDTLAHELCHAACWIIDGHLKDGHGPVWKKWVAKTLQVYPELVSIPVCHTLTIHFKYTFKCTICGYRTNRHSKSINVTKNRCYYCNGPLECIVNKKNKDGLIVSTPIKANKREPSKFALFVKENYVHERGNVLSHKQTMQILSANFAAFKNTPCKLDLNKDVLQNGCPEI